MRIKKIPFYFFLSCKIGADQAIYCAVVRIQKSSTEMGSNTYPKFRPLSLYIRPHQLSQIRLYIEFKYVQTHRQRVFFILCYRSVLFLNTKRNVRLASLCGLFIYCIDIYGHYYAIVLLYYIY